MNFDWATWQVHVDAAEKYLNTCSQILTAENFDSALECLPNEYRCINIVGNLDDSGLNKESLLGLIRVLPVALHCDFFVTSYPWDKQPHAGLFVSIGLFLNGHRLTLSFADQTVFFKLSKRKVMHYKGFMTGEAVIVDQEDMGQIEKLLQMMVD